MSLSALIEKIKFGKFSRDEILKLIEAAEVMQSRLEWIAKAPDKNVDVLEAIYINEAAKALKRADSICEVKS